MRRRRRHGPCDRELGEEERRASWWWRRRGERCSIDDVGWKWRGWRGVYRLIEVGQAAVNGPEHSTMVDRYLDMEKDDLSISTAWLAWVRMRVAALELPETGEHAGRVGF